MKVQGGSTVDRVVVYERLANYDVDEEEFSNTEIFHNKRGHIGRNEAIRCLKLFCSLLVLVVLMVVISLVIARVLKALENNPDQEQESRPTVNSHPLHQAKYPEWQREFTGYGSESMIRLVDIDGDKQQEIIFGGFPSLYMTEYYQYGKKDMETICEDRNISYPCFGSVFALRGRDGEILWETKTRMVPIFLNCAEFDINQDGTVDCIVTGRMATIQAINVKNGETLWMGEDTFLRKRWNTFQVMALPDFNNETVPEVLLVTGGDPSIADADPMRESGRMILLDGRTGTNMGVRYLSMPQSKETYQSPVSYLCKDGSQYILFASGGETIPGDYMMISVPDFYRYVMKLNHTAPVPNVRGSYGQWPHIQRSNNTGIMVIYRGLRAGSMVPPLMVDMNNDGVDDILLSVFDGAMVLLDGQTLNQIWKTDFSNMQSYSSPAPGYFNDDDTLDFMSQWSSGKWGIYNDTKKVIIDGRDGSVMWDQDFTRFQESSDISLKTTQRNRDIFIFKTIGLGAKSTLESHGRPTRPAVNKKLVKRHGDHGEKKHYSSNFTDISNISKIRQEVEDNTKLNKFSCENEVDIKSEIFLMDRSIVDAPIKVSETLPQRYYYNVTDRKSYGDMNKTYCSLLLPGDSASGFYSVGDVDGDRSLDLVVMDIVTGSPAYKKGVYFNFFVKKINLEAYLRKEPTNNPNNSHLSDTKHVKEKKISSLQLLPNEKQMWTTYLGSKENSHFKKSFS